MLKYVITMAASAEAAKAMSSEEMRKEVGQLIEQIKPESIYFPLSEDLSLLWQMLTTHTSSFGTSLRDYRDSAKQPLIQFVSGRVQPFYGATSDKMTSCDTSETLRARIRHL